MTEQTRRREITWEDPAIFARRIGELSGLEFLRAIGRGELPPPPIMRTVGFSALEAEEGRVVFSLDPGEHQYNPLGMVHGGVAATVCDTAMGCAVHSLLPPGRGYTTLELKVNFVRPITTRSGPIRCEGTVVHLGGRTATAEARMTDAEGTLYAHATTTCLLLDHGPR